MRLWPRRVLGQKAGGGGRAVKVQPDSGGGGGGGGSDSKSSEGKMGVFWVLPAGLSSTDIKDIKSGKGIFDTWVGFDQGRCGSKSESSHLRTEP